MATNENVIGVRADLIMEDFDRHVKEYNSRLKEANKRTEEFYKENEQQTEQHQESISQSLSATRESFVDFAAKVTGIIGAIVVAYKVLKDAAEFRSMIIAGSNLATSYGVNFNKVIRALQEASRGEVSFRDAVALTNKALAVGGAEMVGYLPKLFKVAEAASLATGKDTTQILETLVQGIAKVSPRLITQAEIYIKLKDSVEEYAAAQGKSVQDMTLTEQRQALLNDVLEQGADLYRRVGGEAADLAGGFDKFEAAITETKDALGLVEVELLKVGEFLEFMAGGFTALNQLVAMSTGGLVFLLETLVGIQQAGLHVGIKGIGGIGIGGGKPLDLGAILAEANRKSEEAFLAVAGIVRPDEAAIATGAAAVALAIETERIKAEQEKLAAQLSGYNAKIEDSQIKAGESILTAEKDFQDKSAKAWSDYIQKTSDIIAEGISARAKIQQTYNDTIASAERDYQRGIEAANYAHGQRMAAIEQNYQDTIRAIQQTYQEDSLDAVRNLDAIGLIRAREKRDKDLAAAAQDRDRASSAEQENYSRALYELTRALADKRDEAERSRERELDEQKRTEQDKLDAAKRAYNDQQTEAQNAFNARIAAIRAQYTQEDIEAQAHYLNQQTLLTQHLEAMRAIMAAYGMLAGDTSPSGPTPRRERAAGGVDIVNTPTQFLAGEAGPEIVYTAPLNRALPSPIMQTVSHTGDFSHSIDAAINSSVAGLDGRIMAAVRKAIGEVVR